VIANEFTEAGTDLHISALMEIGLVLFAITIATNAVSRILIRRMTRQSKGMPRRAVLAGAPA
jgi:phosphate transport system permease protein